MIHKRDTNWVKLCKKLFQYSNHSRYLLGCVVVKGGRVINMGINVEFKGSKGYLRKHRKNLALHAEVAALHGISKKNSKGSTLYVIGQTKAGNCILSKPCATCLLFINQMGIKRVVYGNIRGEVMELSKNDLSRLVNKVTYLGRLN